MYYLDETLNHDRKAIYRVLVILYIGLLDGFEAFDLSYLGRIFYYNRIIACLSACLSAYLSTLLPERLLSPFKA
ncbi:uncharacterized protein BDW43DRAFT_284044 [Aspergillus alliaceus]|uniref:uncharacterized protein n=1 Tax=Petromyces alliaceus TaxID=209559 RepID=UPI0012A6A252|nr:uncharacterized protein BDW43DRAFT_284044 [Aspergillus alliaceus]KAB8230802.1 hypothetical protein BDW43DRAFT_284044 [Aspergillus alliaceus]